MQKPIIGLTTSLQKINTLFTNNREVVLLGSEYIQLVNDYDCLPILITNQYDVNDIENIVDKIDGLILSGGQDIDPLLYSEENYINYSKEVIKFGESFKRPIYYKPDTKRDKTEIELYKISKQKEIPILGICRGLQLINVAEGGNLYQEIPDNFLKSHFIHANGNLRYHPINISQDSYIFHCLKVKRYYVSSAHHQAINIIGDSLFKSGWSDDGIVEIVEIIDKKHFIIGIQGHIELTRNKLYLYEKLLSEFFSRVHLNFKNNL